MLYLVLQSGLGSRSARSRMIWLYFFFKSRSGSILKLGREMDLESNLT